MACHITHTPRRHINLLACCWPAARTDTHTHTNQMWSWHLRKCPVVSRSSERAVGSSLPQHVYHNRAINFMRLSQLHTILWFSWLFREKLVEIGKSVVASVANFAYFLPASSVSQSVSQSTSQPVKQPVHNNSTLDWRGVTHNEPMLSIRHARPRSCHVFACFRCGKQLKQTFYLSILIDGISLTFFCGKGRSSSLFAFN